MAFSRTIVALSVRLLIASAILGAAQQGLAQPRPGDGLQAGIEPLPPVADSPLLAPTVLRREPERLAFNRQTAAAADDDPSDQSDSDESKSDDDKDPFLFPFLNTLIDEDSWDDEADPVVAQAERLARREQADIGDPGPDTVNFPNGPYTLPKGRMYIENSPLGY